MFRRKQTLLAGLLMAALSSPFCGPFSVLSGQTIAHAAEQPGAAEQPAAMEQAGMETAKGQTGADREKKEKPPTDVTANAMEILDEKNLIIFTGDVKVVRGDTTLLADRLEVHLEKAKNEKGEEERRMREWVATGNVRIMQPNTTITGKKAIMDSQAELLTVEGDVLVKKPDATIKGDKLVANLKTNKFRMAATRKETRVHGVFR